MTGVYCMGRLSEYINGYSGSRPSYGWKGSRRGSVVGAPREANGMVEISGYKETEALIDSLLSSEPTMDRLLKKLIRAAFREARNKTSRDLKANIVNDPRKSHRAVRFVVYKRIFGANINILAKRRASNSGASTPLPRKLDQNPHQRGGNRMKQSDRTKQLNSYTGSDRGFVLRFLSSGTDSRTSRYGNRGSMRTTNMFGYISLPHMEEAVREIHDAVAEYINQLKA